MNEWVSGRRGDGCEARLMAQGVLEWMDGWHGEKASKSPTQSPHSVAFASGWSTVGSQKKERKTTKEEEKKAST
jgi:hypothetical protein